MQELDEINRVIIEKFKLNEVSNKTFTSQMQNNKRIVSLVLKIAKEQKQHERDKNPVILQIHQSLQNNLADGEEINKAIFYCKLILSTLREIENHLKKAKIYDTIGKSYYETQVLKQIIKDEINTLERVFPELINHLEKFDTQIQIIAESSYDFKLEIIANQGIIPINSIKTQIKNITSESKISNSILKTRKILDYLSHYLSLVLIESQRNRKSIINKISEIIKSIVKIHVS